MTTANDARRAHELVDAIGDGRILSSIDVDFLRSFLPERPKPVTLADLLDRVHDAWISANPSDWGFDTPAEHHDWLFDLRNDLVRIIEEQDTPAAEPENVAATVHSLPAGMRLAEHVNFGRVVVSPGVGVDKCHEIFYLDPGMSSGTDISEVEPDSLTFIDAEPAKPAHPEFLETEADYQNAPEGTIVACDDSPPWHKFDSAWLSTAAYEGNNAKNMTGVIREVLRWSWGNE